MTARDSGAVIIAKRSGTVDSVDSERIIVRVEGNVQEGQLSREVGADIYTMTKFKRSNQNTCINQKPIVHGLRLAHHDGGPVHAHLATIRQEIMRAEEHRLTSDWLAR